MLRYMMYTYCTCIIDKASISFEHRFRKSCFMPVWSKSSKVGKTLCTIFSCMLGHTEEKQMANTLVTAALKSFGRN